MRFLYCSITPDCICTPGDPWHMKAIKPYWPISHLIDERVPLWRWRCTG